MPDSGPGQLRILHVDDDPVSRRVMDAFLNILGHVPRSAASGAEALARLAEEDFDLVITDLHMPEMDGSALLAKTRTREPDTAALPVIAITADVMRSKPADQLALGFAGCLAKPLLIPQLEALLRQVVAAKRPAAAWTG